MIGEKVDDDSVVFVLVVVVVASSLLGVVHLCCWGIPSSLLLMHLM